MSEASPLPQPVSSPATLGGNLRRARLERGLSLRALARQLDVSPSLVSQIETGRNQPSVRTLYAMVSKLGVSLDDVFQLGDDEVEAPAASDNAGAAGTVQRADERSAIDLETGVSWERLTTHDVPGVEFLHSSTRPEASPRPPLRSSATAGGSSGTCARASSVSRSASSSMSSARATRSASIRPCPIACTTTATKS